MSKVSMELVKELRQRTGAGIMDCKTALAESEGDTEAAVEWIRKKGLAKAAKKAGAIAAEGMIHAYIHPGSRLGVLVEINCQTDFVARAEEFKGYADAVGLQIASMSAQFVRRSEVPADEVEKQKAIFRAQMEEEVAQGAKAKPEAVVEKILDGKVDKWLAEVCLEEQNSVVDPDKTIAAMAEELTTKLGEKIAVRRFVRYELGEGIEKKQAGSFADEVAETLKGG